MDFTGKSVLITGAAVGIGRDTAVAYGRLGARVGINYSKSREEAEKTLEMVREAGGEGLLCQGDVSREEDAVRIVRQTSEAFGPLDILVNNAGITKFIPFADLDSANPDIWRRLYEVNVIGSFLCARAAAEIMKEKGGVIVNLSSIAGQRASASSIPYGVTKAAILHMTRCLAVALAPKIRVVSVSPGVIDDTRWNEGRTGVDMAAIFSQLAESTPLKRPGHAADITPAILFLSSGEASFCTGIDLLVDGGRWLSV